MSLGYSVPLPSFTGPDSGPVRNNRAAKIEAARKTAIGVTEHGDTVFSLDETVEYWAVESDYDEHRRWVGTVHDDYTLPAGTLVRETNWEPLRAPTRWVDHATSTGWRAGERIGPMAAHQNPARPGIIWPEPTGKLGDGRHLIEATIAARWVIENLDLPERDFGGRPLSIYERVDHWYDLLCFAALEVQRGYGAGNYGPFAVNALRQYAQGQTDAAICRREAARQRRRETARRRRESPGLKTGH